MSGLTGTIGQLLLAVGIAGEILALLRVPLRRRPLALFAVGVAALLPFGGVSLVQLGRGAIGDLSFTTQALFLIAILRRTGGTHPLLRPWRRDVCAGILLAELALAFSTVGLLRLDLYAWGYAPQAFLLGVLGILLALRRVEPALAFAGLAGVAAFAGGWLESPNLWDYLIDPVALAPMLVRFCSFRFRPKTVDRTR